MSRTLRPLAALAMVATVAVISAGCGGTRSSGGTSTAASAGNTGTAASAGNTGTASSTGTGSSGGTNTASPHAKAVKFAECMRANGVSAFPDPDATGVLTIDAVANGSSLDTSSAAFEQALSACKDLEPPGFTGTKVKTAQQREARLEFAQCIRDNGVRDFPDPADDQPLIDTRRIPSAATEGGMSILHAAMKKCASYSGKLGVRSQ
jgi:hypothetical protein